MLRIEYWYSNGGKVGCWTTTPTISKLKLNNNSNFVFDDGYSRARSQWSSAGIATTNNGSSSSSKIFCRGGTVSELSAASGISESSFSGLNGLTRYSSSFQNYLSYGTERKSLYHMNSAKIYILDHDNTSNQLKKTFIHEVGHALGWFNHSTVSSDIMYGYGSSVTTLTTRDKKHLIQFY